MKTRRYTLTLLALLCLVLPVQAMTQMAYLINSSGQILSQNANVLGHATEAISGTQWTLLTGNSIIRNGVTHAVTGLDAGVSLQRIAAETATSAFVFGDNGWAYLVDDSGAVTYSTNGIRDLVTNPYDGSTWTLYDVSTNLLNRNGNFVYLSGVPAGVRIEYISPETSNMMLLFGDNGYMYPINNSGVVEGGTDGIYDYSVGPIASSNYTNWTLYKVNNFIYYNLGTPIYLQGLPEGTTLTRISAVDATTAYVFAIPEPEYAVIGFTMLAILTFIWRKRRTLTPRQA